MTTYRANGKNPTFKWLRGWDANLPKNHTHSKKRRLIIQGNSKPTTSPWEAKGLNPKSGTPTFKTHTLETSPQNI